VVWGKALFEVMMDRLISEAEFMLLGNRYADQGDCLRVGFFLGGEFGMYFRRAKGWGRWLLG